MKNCLLAFLLFCCMSTSGFSQLITNTYWTGYDSTNTMDMFWHFGTDSVFFSADNITYSVVSTFTETTSVFRLADVASGPGQCLLSDTGTYLKSFSADTMWLSLVVDSCLSREEYLTSHYFVALPTTVNENNTNNLFSIMPNPTSGIFTVVATGVQEVMITDLTGRIIETVKCSGSVTINLNDRPAGIYFVSLIYADHISTQRIVRE